MIRICICLIAAAVVSQTPTPPIIAPVRPSLARYGCRTFATSTRQVTKSPISTTEVVTTHKYDALAHKWTGTGTMTDNRGTHLAMTTVTNYASAEDVVNEIVRASGTKGFTTAGQGQFNAPAGAFESSDAGRALILGAPFADGYRLIDRYISPTSIAPNQPPTGEAANNIEWAIVTIPPLKLHTSVVITGGVNTTTMNEFDKYGRIVKMTSGPGPGSSNTYTEWDRFGRPTAGTGEGPGFTQTITMTRDDTQRTETATYKTKMAGTADPTTAVYKTYYDTNGTMILQEVRTPAGETRTTVTIESTTKVCAGPTNPAR